MTPPLPPATALPRPSLLLAVSSAALKISAAATSPARGVRWQGVGVGGRSERSRPVGRRRAAAVEEAGAQEDGVLLPKDGSEAAGRYDWREEWYPLYLSKEVPHDAALPLTVFDRQLVLYRDAGGVLRCHEDRCPHRLAKLSEGQLVDGKLECLYHGWQFDGQGKCVKIPQLPEGAKIPRNACARNYEVRDSQGVVWVWMSPASPPDAKKLPWFEPYARPGFTDLSTVHELPYDHSILLENLMDPAHVPISHDRTDWTAKREDAQPLAFDVAERTARGFAGHWWRERAPHLRNLLRFEAPCVLSNTLEFVDKDGKEQCFSAQFLCRPAGQGKSMLLVRFGSTASSPLVKVLPKWYLHQNACKVFEQDMGFLSSQNEVLLREKVPTKELYLNLRSSDTWVAEYRRWMDRAGHSGGLTGWPGWAAAHPGILHPVNLLGLWSARIARGQRSAGPRFPPAAQRQLPFPIPTSPRPRVSPAAAGSPATASVPSPVRQSASAVGAPRPLLHAYVATPLLQPPGDQASTPSTLRASDDQRAAGRSRRPMLLPP